LDENDEAHNTMRGAMKIVPGGAFKCCRTSASFALSKDLPKEEETWPSRYGSAVLIRVAAELALVVGLPAALPG